MKSKLELAILHFCRNRKSLSIGQISKMNDEDLIKNLDVNTLEKVVNALTKMIQ